jgi:hypothetical protein
VNSTRRLVLALVGSLAAILLVVPAAISNSVSLNETMTGPAPVPQAPAHFIRQIPLTANDVIYSPATMMLYASVPSSVGVGGNSIKTIDPTTGTINNSVFVGSEPNKLALADDGSTLYTSLNGAFAVRRFDISTQTAGAQFPLGQESNGVYAAADLAVLPGSPDSVAVARTLTTFGFSSNVAVFDNGVRRATTASTSSSFLAFSASAAKLYGSGSFNGLTTMTINTSGVTIASTNSLTSGWRTKFDAGLIYAGSGQVVNPDTGTLLGTFSGTNTQAFVPDSSVGRAYYLVPDQFGSSTRTLKAFDINTFVLVGSLTITGVSGDTTNLVRWGSNGLAFRTSGNQLFIIQTSLIPSGDPIPTPTPTSSPTPTPSPSPIAAFVRQISLATNDLIYNPNIQSLYASVPSTVGGTRGNSVTLIDPATATVGSSVFIGSEPHKLALSDDLQTLYVGLTGAGAVRRFDVNSQTAGFEFTLGNDVNNGPRFATDIAVMPGTPGTVAVVRNSNFGSSSVAVYDDGVPRTQTLNTPGSIRFRDTSTLYLGNGAIQKLGVGALGLSLVSTTQTGGSGNIFYDNGLVYMTGGPVVDPEAGVVKGTFTGASGIVMAVDPAIGRAFLLSSGFPSTLRAYDINTFLPLGSITIQGINGTPTSLVRWGTNGLAFRTTSNQVFLIQSALVDPSGSVPEPTPTPSPTPSPSPPYIPTFARKLDLQANDLVIDQTTQLIYASVRSAQGLEGNSITKIDPATATIGPSVFIGSEPNKLAISGDGSTLHVSLDGAAAIRRFDIPTMTAGPQFTWGTPTQRPQDIAVVPGSPLSIVTSDGFGVGAAVYDDGVRRPNTSKGTASAIGPLAFGADPATLYGYDNQSSGSVVKFSLDANGVNAPATTRNLLTGASMKFTNGLLYSSAGRVVDPEAQRLIGTFQSGFAGALAVDQALGRVFFINTNFSSSLILSAYDINTFVPIGSVTLPPLVPGGFFNQPTSLVRWGANGLALRVSSSNPPNFSQTSAVYLIQSELVSSSASVPTGLSFSSPTYGTSEGGQLTITVNRSGNVSMTTTVDYATNNGTATAGSDYTSATGTLTFAPGELTKTFQIPILNDNLYEAGNETLTVTLSNPSGAAILISPSTSAVTIFDSQQRPFVSMAGVSLTEGNSGQKTFSFPVTLSNRSVETVTVDFTTADNTATVAGNDYVATSGTLTFPPGSNSGLINVSVNGDTNIEGDETFLVRLSNGTNINFIVTSQVFGTIQNDDTLIQFSAASYSVAENAGSANITITRTGSAAAATVLFSTSNGTATSGDYTSVSQTVTFSSGQFSRTVTVPIIDDSTYEADETVNLSLTNASGPAQIGVPATAVLTITNNDAKPTLSITDVSVTEANSGTANLTFTVTLSAVSSLTVNVDYATADGTATASDNDYQSTSGTLTFNPDDLTKTVTVLVNGDQKTEPDETVFVVLSNPVDAAFSDSQGTGTILNDDTLLLLLDTSGPDANQLAALDSLLLIRDPFRVANQAPLFTSEQNTRVILFALNLQLNSGESPTVVKVMLVDGNGGTHEVAAEDVRSIADTSFTQVTFRLPDALAQGTCLVTIKAHERISNTGTFQIAP